MASYKPYKEGVRVQVYVGGVRDSGTFRTKREAAAWASAREIELRRFAKATPGEKYTLSDAMRKYLAEVSPKKKGARWELLRIDAFMLDINLPTKRPIGELTTTHLSEWRDARLKQVKPGTVRREISLLSDILETARREWRWIESNPMRDMRKPKPPEHKTTTISQSQIRIIVQEMGYSPRKPVSTVSQAAALCFLVALRTGMRAGELCGLTWDRVHDGFFHLPKTKNGTARDVPITKKTRLLLDRIAGYNNKLVFGITSASLDALFRKYRKRAGLSGFTFHDARRTAATCLSKKLDVLTLCKMFGWKNPQMAMVYYSPSQSDIVQMLER